MPEIDSDFDAVVRMLLLARWVKAGRELDDWLQSMRDHLHNEIDYQREATLTQQMAKKYLGTPLQPSELRELLSNRELGTACEVDRKSPKGIGVMPDLGKVEQYLKTSGAAGRP